MSNYEIESKPLDAPRPGLSPAPAYLVLDAAQIENIDQWINQHSHIEHVRNLFLTTPHESCAEVGPRLVKLDHTSNLIDSFWQYGPSAHAGILIECPDEKALAKHCLWLNYATEQSGQTILFRWFDPRGLWRMLNYIENGEAQKLLGPISRITIPDIQNQCWRTYENPEAQAIIEQGAADYSQPLALNEDYERAFIELIQLCLIEQALNYLNQYYPACMAGLNDEQAYARVTHWVTEAQRLGFESNASIYYFSAILAMLGPEVYQQPSPYPEIATLLTQTSAQTPEQRIAAAFNQAEQIAKTI